MTVKATEPTDAERALALVTALADANVTPRQADAARRLGMRGTSFRDVTRGLGVYVSRGGEWVGAARIATLRHPRVIAAMARTLGVETDTVREALATLAP